MCQLLSTALLDDNKAFSNPYVHQMAIAASTEENAAADSTETSLLLRVEPHTIATLLRLTVSVAL